MHQKKSFTLVAIGLCLTLLLSACAGLPGSGGAGPTDPTATAQAAQSTPTSTSALSQSTPTATPTSPASGSLEQIDWSNYTYTFQCFTSQPVQVTMKNGEADQNDVHYTVQKPVFGDLNGDGQPEAVIIYHCEGGGTSPQLVFVYSGTEQLPVVIAYLPGDGDKIATVIQAAVVAGVLQLTGYGYSPNVPLCCPDLLVTTTYKWNGSSFTIVTSNSIPRPPGS